MTPERWHRIEALLHAALEKPPTERSVFLDAACTGDAGLRREVEELMAADEAASDDFLDRRLHPHAAQLVEGMRDRMQHGLPSIEGPPPGTMIGSYELVGEIGRGGMGVVYKARDSRLNRFVALKFLHVDADARTSIRFLAEAQAASALDHPNICTVHEISRTEEGETFIAMAYYEGQTLQQRLAEGPLPVEEALSIAAQAAAGLAEAHRHGVVHRDVKPANLILTANGIVKIVDFGLAKLSNLALTQTRRMMGTIPYMSPEQARGEAVDERTDLWALGVVLYEMLAGQRPFSGAQEAAVLYAILETTPPPLTTLRPEVPEAIARLVEALLCKDPAERFGPMAEVRALLDTAGTTERMPAALMKRSPRRYMRRLWLALPVVLLLSLVAWGLWGRVDPAPAPPPRSAIAVLPFFVRGDAALSYLQDGMVDLLSTKLDGVDGLRSIDPHALLGFVAQTPNRVLDPERGREVAAHFGAGHYVLGSVVQLGDRLQLNAYLYDADGMEQIRAQASVTDESELLAALDDLAKQLVAARLTTPEEQLASLAAMTTTSFPALQAYLNGERALREGRFETAVATLQRAVALDSTFALAWYRLARASGWTGPAELNERAIARALAHSHHLPERARLLVRAYDAYRNGDPAVAERGYRALLATYPDYAEAWLLLGETLFHNNPFYGRSTLEAREPLERALAFNPNDREILVHLMDLAAKQQRWDALETLATRYFAPLLEGQHVEVWHTYQALQRIGAHQPDPPKAIFDNLAEAGPAALRTALERIAPPLEDLAVTTRLAERLVQPSHAPSWQAAGHLYLANIAVARGQWRAADSAFTAVAAVSPGWARLHRVLAYTLPEAPLARPVLEALRGETAQWNALDTSWPGGLHAGEMDVVQAYLLGLLSFRLADVEAVRTQVHQLEARAEASSNALARASALTLEALLAWHQDDPDAALALLDEAQMPMPFHVRGRSPLYEQLLNRYLRAHILAAEGRPREALDGYASLYDGYHQWGLIYLGPSYQHRAALYERLGEREQAAYFYERFITLRQDADPALQPAVARARQQLDSLRAAPAR